MIFCSQTFFHIKEEAKSEEFSTFLGRDNHVPVGVAQPMGKLTTSEPSFVAFIAEQKAKQTTSWRIVSS